MLRQLNIIIRIVLVRLTFQESKSNNGTQGNKEEKKKTILQKFLLLSVVSNTFHKTRIFTVKHMHFQRIFERVITLQ